ncbi:hypothetical protein KXR87_22505 [Yokenella regensburgei]|uniref:hypothetical protein n=1 Tax=Yokenella regensburgei TaxID=158877 RepID=UPI003F1685E6
MKNLNCRCEGSTINLHDNKVWGVRFNFDSSQLLIPPHLIVDIDYEVGSEFSAIDNNIIFYISPAKLIFNFVSSFNFNISSGRESENNYRADCLYIYRLEKEIMNKERTYFKMIFCDDVGYIDFYAKDFSLIISKEKNIKLKGWITSQFNQD